MKQLVNKYDGRVRLIVLDAKVEGNYIKFDLPTEIGECGCMWRADMWELKDLDRPGEDTTLLAWIRKELDRRKFTAKGVSLSCGMSYGWLGMVLAGKIRLKPKTEALLEEAIGLKKGAIARKRREILHNS